jgi:hypothetical protein
MRAVRVSLVMGLILILVIAIGALQASATPGLINLGSRPQATSATVGVKVGSVYSPTSGPSTFKLNIDLEGGTNIGAFEYDLDYGTGIVTATTATTATWLTSTAREGIKLGPIWPGTSKVAFGEATCGQTGCSDPNTPIPNPVPPPASGPNGNGTLSSVAFNVIGRGVVPMTLSNVQVTDIDAVTQTVVITGANIGVFTYTVVPGVGAGTKYNSAAIATVQPGITNADSMRTYLESQLGANTVVALLKWNAALQTYVVRQKVGASWIGSNFSLLTGDSVLYKVNSSTSKNEALFVGDAPSPDVTFPIVAGTSSTTCKYNEISLPLNKGSITTAQQLADDPAWLGSVRKLLRWNPSLQTFEVRQKVGVSWIGSNFAVRIGDPVLVCVNDAAPAQWP